MNVLKTLQYMKPDIKVCVWDNDIDQIVYNDTETFQPTKEDILAVDQDAVTAYWAQQDAAAVQLTKDQLQQQLITIYNQIQQLEQGEQNVS